MKLHDITPLAVTLVLACNSSTRDPNTVPPTPGRDASTAVDSGQPDASAPVDGEAATDGGVVADAGSSADSDAGSSADSDAAAPDDSLAGTSLEGVPIEWASALELCNEWRESRSLDEELAAKVRIVLPPHGRPSLGRAHLSAATLTAGALTRAPHGGQAWSIADLGVRSTLMEWELSDPTGITRIRASIEHDLGPAGVLTEALQLSRPRGAPEPVVYGSPYYEAAFYWRPAGGDAQATALLGRCGGPEDLDGAVAVLTGSNRGGSVTVVRYFRTQQTLAGSYPVHLQGAQVMFSGQGWRRIEVHGFWPQTYAAGHHNWGEHSVIDFTRDLGWYGTVFGPIARGEQPSVTRAYEKIELIDVNGWSVGARIEVVDTDQNVTRFDVSEQWVRIDEPGLERESRMACRGGDVVTYQSFEHAVALLTCPGPGPLGFDLRTVVPLIYGSDVSQIGRRITGRDIIQLRSGNGYEIRTGAGRVVIEDTGAGRIRLTVNDGAGTPIDSSTVEDQPFTYEGPRDNTLVGTNAAEGLSMRLGRRWVAQGSGHSQIYAPVEFELRFGGHTHRVTAWDRMAYTNTHHNWRDAIVARTETLALEWSVEFDIMGGGGLQHRVRATQIADGSEVLPWTSIDVVQQ